MNTTINSHSQEPTYYIFTDEDAIPARRRVWEKYLQHKHPEDKLSLYVHIPFCSRKCRYCAFDSQMLTEAIIDDVLLDHLIDDMQQVADVLSGEVIDTMSFGGGSPTLLTPKQLDRLLTAIDTIWNLSTDPKTAKGFEGHPHQLTSDHIQILRDSFINRMSMGVQSLQPQVLKAENRAYTSVAMLSDLYDQLRTAVLSVNLDLLIGLYEQTEDMVLQDTRDLLSVGTETVFVYELHPTVSHNVNKPWVDAVARSLYRTVYPEVQATHTYSGTTDTISRDNNIFTRKDAHVFEREHPTAPFGFTNVVGFSAALPPKESNNPKAYRHIPTALSFATGAGLASHSIHGSVAITNMAEEIQTRHPKWSTAYDVRSQY